MSQYLRCDSSVELSSAKYCWKLIWEPYWMFDCIVISWYRIRNLNLFDITWIKQLYMKSLSYFHQASFGRFRFFIISTVQFSCISGKHGMNPNRVTEFLCWESKSLTSCSFSHLNYNWGTMIHLMMICVLQDQRVVKKCSNSN